MLDHPKYKEIFETYGDAIGINNPPKIPEWETLELRVTAAKKVKEQIDQLKKEILEKYE